MKPLYTIPKNKNKQELSVHGTPLFPCSIYNRDVRQYITGEIPPHWHREMEIFLLMEGYAHISLAESEFDLQPGEMLFVNSGILHGVFNPSGRCCRYHSIVFDPSVISGVPGSAYDVLYIQPLIEQGGPAWTSHSKDEATAEIAIQLFKTAFDACDSKAEGYEFIVRDALSRIILALKKQLHECASHKNRVQEARMKQMLSWIDEHYTETITVSQLASANGICVRECQRSFSRTLHLTPVEYLTRRRIAAAAELLLSTDLPIGEAGLRCGFDNPSYFAKQFKSIIGMPPRAYRQKYTAS